MHAPPLTSSLEMLDLRRMGSPRIRRMLLLDTQPGSLLGSWNQYLEGWPNLERQYRMVALPAVWAKQKDDFGNVMVPLPVIDAILEWMRESYG